MICIVLLCSLPAIFIKSDYLEKILEDEQEINLTCSVEGMVMRSISEDERTVAFRCEQGEI